MNRGRGARTPQGCALAHLPLLLITRKPHAHPYDVMPCTPLTAAACASAKAVAGVCVPVQMVASALATGVQRADMNGVFGSGVPYWASSAKPEMAGLLFTDGSCSACWFAGISPVSLIMPSWFW